MPLGISRDVQCHGNLLPIITLATRPLGGQGLKGKAYSIRCDISLFQESHNGLQTNRYLQSLTRELTPLTPLVLVMKEFYLNKDFNVIYWWFILVWIGFIGFSFLQSRLKTI